MDSLYKNGRVRSYILIFLIFASFIISVPLKRKVSSVVSDKVEYFSDYFNQQTGLHISYKTLSPSLLSNFFIKNISVVDDENNVILSIDKTKVTYNLIKLIKKDFGAGITSIVIDGIKLDVTQVLELVNQFQKKQSEKSLDFKQIRQMIPGNIKLKNIYFIYDDGNNSASLTLKSVTVNNKMQEKNLDIQVDALINATIASLKGEYSGKVDISGTLEDQIDNSRLNVKVSNLTDGNYKLNKLNLLIVYAKNILEVHTIQAVNPISLGADYNILSGDLNIQLNSENFKPLSLITMTSRQKELQKYQNLKITTDTILKCNLKEKAFDYISDTSAYIPDAIVPGGLTTTIAAYGNQKESEITGLKLNGQRCSVSAKLKYVYDTFQLSGLVEIPSFILNNGKVISTEMYIDPLDKGFMVFTPQIFIGDRALTALQLSMVPRTDSFDFNFELYDYYHLDEVDPGVISLDGSYLSKSNYVQSNITLTNLYLDSMVGILQQFVDENLAAKIAPVEKNLRNYVFSGDVYASTDFKSISYHVPYVLLANSKKENQLVMFSVNGTEQNLQLNQFSLIAGKYAMDMTASVDKNPDSSDLFFTMDMNAGSIPYHFTGTVMPEICNITGDYGTNLEIRFDKNLDVNGRVLFENIPLSIRGTPVILSTDTSFDYTAENGPSIQVQHFEIEGANSNTSVNSRFAFSGNATKYGAQLNSIAYTDLYSALQGTADVMLNINENIFDSVGLMANLKNPLTEENISIDFNVSNPEHLPFNFDNFKKYYYLNLQLIMNDLGINRIAVFKNENNHVSGSLNAFGTIEHPYVALNIEDLNYLISTYFLKGNGNIVLEDRDFNIMDMNILYNNFSIENINASASLLDMKLNAQGNMHLDSNSKTLNAPLVLTIDNALVPEGKLLPDAFTATLATGGFSGTLLKKEFPLSISALYSDKNYTFYSSDNGGLSGIFTEDGVLQLSVDNNSFLKFNMDGIISNDIFNLDLYDVDVALGKMMTYINLDNFIMINKGNLTGEVIASGKLQDPEFTGAAVISSGEVVLPWLTKQKLKVEDMNFLFNHNEINMEDTILSLKSGEKTKINFNFFMNKWNLDYIEGTVSNSPKELFPVKMEMPVFSLAGDVNVNLKLFMDSEKTEIRGLCFGENINLNSSISAISASSQITEDIKTVPILADLNIQLGTHASLDFDPVLRCVFVPNTKFNLKFDQTSNQVLIDGEVKLKSGDIAYLNRNFYIKSGTIDFSQSSVENPIITINAETREKDSNGQTVRIVMDVERQHLLDFEPRFSAIPAKSENEIRIMLGQIAVADSSNAANFLFAASDYAIQSTVVRQAENKLRDLCNFDIFSVRTNVLQNTLNMGVSGELSKKNLSIGNFLDNTTVYIGKYLGSSLYLDAMLHVSFEDNVDINDITTPGKVVFQPEIGMELESPFANIRVNMAPDINALLNNQFVPSTSVTLSWKIAY